MRVLGMISGTSHDGIDAAIVEFTGGPALEGRILHESLTPYSSALREQLIGALPPAATTFAEMCELDTRIGQAFAEAARAAIEEVGGVDLICSHGQTVYHWVEGAHALGTLQIGQPAWIAEATGAPVISDVRIRDITAGGHGAPLVPILDRLLIHGRTERAGALNLGGIANLTVIARGTEPLAYDVGPANALIDAVVTERGLNPLGYDDGGALAASGRVEEDLLARLLADPYYLLPTPKSSGKELFNAQYVRDALGAHGKEISDADLVATLTELTVRTVADAVAGHELQTLYISGGGAHNPVIRGGLARALPAVSVEFTDVLGASVDSKEAIAFALIGWLSAHGLPGAVPSATGSSEGRILGTITPGAGPLALPAPLTQVPTSLRLLPGR